MKDFVYFRSTLPLGAYPKEAEPLAKALSLGLQASGVTVHKIEKHWEDLRLICRFQSQPFFMDLTTYVETQPPLFSLQIRPQGPFFLAWLRAARIRKLVGQIDQILHSDPAFAEIRWHRSRDLRKTGAGDLGDL